jgi:hypothetical protein
MSLNQRYPIVFASQNGQRSNRRKVAANAYSASNIGFFDRQIFANGSIDKEIWHIAQTSAGGGWGIGIQIMNRLRKQHLLHRRHPLGAVVIHAPQLVPDIYRYVDVIVPTRS